MWKLLAVVVFCTLLMPITGQANHGRKSLQRQGPVQGQPAKGQILEFIKLSKKATHIIDTTIQQSGKDISDLVDSILLLLEPLLRTAVFELKDYAEYLMATADSNDEKEA